MSAKDKKDSVPFWKAKPLARLSKKEWESLCDGCGKCCLEKLEDAETGTIEYTDVGCPLLDLETCHCKSYRNRQKHIPDCIKLTPKTIAALKWMPSTCAYRLVAEGKDLPDWHPLISGSANTVHQAGISVKGRVVAFDEAGDLEDHIVSWPE